MQALYIPALLSCHLSSGYSEGQLGKLYSWVCHSVGALNNGQASGGHLMLQHVNLQQAILFVCYAKVRKVTCFAPQIQTEYQIFVSVPVCKQKQWKNSISEYEWHFVNCQFTLNMWKVLWFLFTMTWQRVREQWKSYMQS